MENILFIGNGFDLYNGMETTYIDYLNSLEITEEELEDIFTFIKIHEYFVKLSNVTISFPKVNYGGLNIVKFHNFNFSNLDDDFNKHIMNIKSLYNNNESIRLDHQKLKDIPDAEKFSILYLMSYEIISFTYITSDTVTFEGELFNELADLYNCDDELFFENILKTNYFELCTKIDIIKNKYSIFSIYLEIIRKKIIYDNYYIKELQAGEDWIDIENILYFNQFKYFKSFIYGNYAIQSIFRYENFIKVFDNNLKMEDDFNKFKHNFTKFIELEQDKIDTIDIRYFMENCIAFFDITNIYNFNYSNYINQIIKEIDKDIFIDNIHGSIKDGADIVFGTNHYLFKNDLDTYNNESRVIENKNLFANEEQHYSLTKMYQVLKLSEKRNSKKIEKANSLTILGHSIGKQDFEYMHTIIQTNPSDIKINVIWSEYFNKEGVLQNNLNSLTKAVYEMLGMYEDLYGDITFHRMILENRIHFIFIKDFEKSDE